MAKRGASAARLLPRETLVELEYDGCYLIYDKGGLCYCDDEWNKPKWDVEARQNTAWHHKHELILRLNKSLSDNQNTNHPNNESNGLPVPNFGLGEPDPDSSGWFISGSLP